MIHCKGNALYLDLDDGCICSEHIFSPYLNNVFLFVYISSFHIVVFRCFLEKNLELLVTELKITLSKYIVLH